MTETSAGSSGCLTAKGLEISLAALKRHDPYINTIVDVASQVALYTYNKKNEWEKTEVEGTLFIYTRLASPKHGFTIMNRLSIENLTEPITKDLDFQLQHPFLLYRNARLVIHGIWFYDKEDCERVAQKMKILTQQEQALAHSQGGWLSPGGGRGEAGEEGKAVDIIKMLTKARTEFDKGQSTSEPKEISGRSMLCGNPNLIKPIPVKPNAQDTEGAEPKPLSLATLFGTKQHHNHPHQKPHPVSLYAVPGGGTASSSKVTHPPVARTLTYEGELNSGRVLTSNEGNVISPEGPDRGVGAVITGQTVRDDSGIVAVQQQQQDQHQHCPAIQKLIQGPRGVGVALQTVPKSPENRLFDNGLPLGHHHHHLIHHHHHLPQQQLHPSDPIKRLFQTQPPPPPSSAAFTSAAPQPCCSHPPPPQQQNPHLSSQPVMVDAVAWSHLQEQQSRQHFVGLNKPLAEVQHSSQSASAVQGAGLLPTQVTNDQVLPPAQALFAQMPGVVSPHELLQKLQLVQQEQNLVSHNAPRLSGGLAPRFLAPAQGQGSGSIVAPVVNPSAAAASQNASSQFQDCNLNSVTFPQRIPATETPVLLLSPSVFAQAKSSSGVSAEAPLVQSGLSLPGDSRVLSKSQLQASLLHLIQTDSSFLDTIYETYISRCANNSSAKF